MSLYGNDARSAGYAAAQALSRQLDPRERMPVWLAHLSAVYAGWVAEAVARRGMEVHAPVWTWGEFQTGAAQFRQSHGMLFEGPEVERG